MSEPASVEFLRQFWSPFAGQQFEAWTREALEGTVKRACDDDIPALLARIRELELERDGLREALRYVNGDHPEHDSDTACLKACRQVALDALDPELAAALATDMKES